MAEDPNPQQRVGELFDLTKQYAKQETLDPIKGLFKFVGYGVVAAILGVMSLGMLGLGLLRLIQTETGDHLTGSLTWVPYLGVMIVALIIVGITVAGISAKKGSDR